MKGFSLGTAREVFKELNGRTFQNYAELEIVVVELYNKYLGYWPSGYHYRNLLDLGERNGWIRQEGSLLVVLYDAKTDEVRSLIMQG